jgi:putative tryptophan/tyrosine transport system substrate-binding protein
MAIKPIIGLLVSLALASFRLAEAQQPAKILRIGYLSSTSSERQKSRLLAFQQGLRDLGYVEGKNIIIEYRNDDRYERLSVLVAELVRLNVDVLVAAGAPAAHAAKERDQDDSHRYAKWRSGGDWACREPGAAPGWEYHGTLGLPTVGVVTKRLKLLKEVVPSVSRVAVLWNATNPTNAVTLKETRP